MSYVDLLAGSMFSVQLDAASSKIDQARPFKGAPWGKFVIWLCAHSDEKVKVVDVTWYETVFTFYT